MSELQPRHAAGTIVEGSSDPRTVEQNAALRAMSTTDGRSQYAGLLLLPNGTRSRNLGDMVLTEDWQRTYWNSVINAAGKLNADGVTRSGGFIIILNIYGTPVQAYGVSAANVQSNLEAALGEVPGVNASTGNSHLTAIRLAERGVQTDGVPVTESYLDLMQRWATADGISFVRPSAEVRAAAARPAPAAVVTASGQGIAAVQPNNPIPVQPVQTIGVQPVMPSPIFTQGAIIPEAATAVPFHMTNQPVLYAAPAGQPSSAAAGGGAPPSMTGANAPTGVATSSAQDASVQAMDNKTVYLALAVVGVLALLAFSGGE